MFGVTEDRLRKDLDLLWVCGLPGHGPGDLIDVEFEGDTITLLEPAGVTRPLRLTADEALALVVALRALAETPGLVERDALDRALAKVERVAGEAAAAGRPGRGGGRGRRARAAGRRAGAGASAAGCTCATTCPARDETTERDVDPMRLAWAEGRPYLEAWCRRAEGVRLFRLDRVAAVTVLDLPAEPPAGRPVARPVPGRVPAVTGRRARRARAAARGALGGRPPPVRVGRGAAGLGARSPGCARPTPAGCGGWSCGSATPRGSWRPRSSPSRCGWTPRRPSRRTTTEPIAAPT